jgi:hypothetical protein
VPGFFELREGKSDTKTAETFKKVSAIPGISIVEKSLFGFYIRIRCRRGFFLRGIERVPKRTDSLSQLTHGFPQAARPEDQHNNN